MTDEDCEASSRAQSWSTKTPLGWPAQRQRRSHNKSRNGCQRCKRRRIKCDEAKPVCGNCSRLSIPCDFSPAPGCDVGATGPESQLVIRKRGRPRKNWAAIPLTGPSASAARLDSAAAAMAAPFALAPSASPELEVQSPLHLPWSVEDLELLYHYQSHTALTQGDTLLWRDRVPRLAFRNHCVLHLILALSALHLLRIRPDESRRFQERADAHLAVGLRQAMAMLSSLNEHNAAALYIATVLVCSCTFAKKPGRGHLLVVAEGDEVAWWELFRGVRIVVERIGIPTLFSGELGPLPGEAPATPYIVYDIGFGFIEWEESVGALSELLVRVAEPSRDTCQSMLSLLLWCFKETYGTAEDPKTRVEGQFERIILWLYCMSDDFVLSLRNKEPVPLVLLAYFAVLLQLLERIWYMQGWAVHVLEGITEILDPDFSSWLQWPAERIKEGTRYIEASKRRGESRYGPEVLPIVQRW